jgi:hypothetical protein
VLNIPRNDPILAKGNFAIVPISLRFRSAMKDVSRQTKKITSILGFYACFPQPHQVLRHILCQACIPQSIRVKEWRFLFLIIAQLSFCFTQFIYSHPGILMHVYLIREVIDFITIAEKTINFRNH